MKTAGLFFSLLRGAKSRRDSILLTAGEAQRNLRQQQSSPRTKSIRDSTLLTVCFSLRKMKTGNLFFSITLALFSCANLCAQATIGGLTDPAAGALLDLNSTNKGGLLLSNVDIPDAGLIPDADPDVFPGVDPDSLDTNWGLRGAVVYNTNPTTGTGIYVWTGKYWMPVADQDDEQILFTVRAADGTYSIPTLGQVGGTYDHAYDWDIRIDNEPETRYRDLAGTSVEISLNLPNTGSEYHQIRISPHDAPVPGWGNAFGHSSVADDKLISIDAPLTTRAFAPKTTEPDAATNASYMFAGLFQGCSNLTVAAVIKDSYKLPETVTDLSYFFAFTYAICSNLTVPQDFSPLSGWLNGNNSIENLSSFLRSIHNRNSMLEVPLDFTPLSGWFKANTSITNLSDFLRGPHYINPRMEDPVDLTPFSGWFSANTTITNLSNFFLEAYINCLSLTAPVDFTPLSGWFSANTSIANLSNFFYYSYSNNTSLKLEGQTIFPDWIKTMTQNGTSIIDVSDTFRSTFTASASLSGDTGEPKFQDGTVLSSLGMPTYNKNTYSNRTGITPLNSNWK
jgi:hypothetical protein